MVNKVVEKAINEQILKEEHSSRIYIAMASWCQVNGYQGAASWLYEQAEEERMHELKLIHYLDDRGGRAELSELKKLNFRFKELEDVFREVLKHEEFISASINDVYAVSLKQNDYSTANFMQWYITEQIEEESSVRSILDMIKLAGGEKGGLFMIDKELAARAGKKGVAKGQAKT